MSQTEPLAQASQMSMHRDPESKPDHPAVQRPPARRPDHLTTHGGKRRTVKVASNRRGMRLVHRWTGVIAGTILVALAITGIGINHARDLGLDQGPVQSRLIMDWYGIPRAVAPVGVALGEDWVVFANDQLVFRGVSNHLALPVGAVRSGELVAAAAQDKLVLLLADNGELVEQIGSENFGGPIKALGHLSDGRVAVQAGDEVFVADDEFLAWTQSPTTIPVQWSQLETPPDGALALITLPHPAPELTWERVLLDLHGGRLFGISGPLLTDMAAFAIIYLFLSGLISWRRNTKKR
jgi:hypothetical protein